MNTDPFLSVLLSEAEAQNLAKPERAKLALVSDKTWQRIENGTSDIKLRHFSALMKGLRLTPLDIALRMEGIKETTAYDVAAAAKVLPPEARTMLVNLIMIMHRDFQAKLERKI